MFTGPLQLSASDIDEIGTRKEQTLGAIGFDKYGNAYRYSKANESGTDLTASMLAVSAVAIANHINKTVVSAVAVGESEVTMNLGATAVTENQYQDGWVIINDAAGEGHKYAIKGHPAASASTTLKLRLDSTIKDALTTASEASLAYGIADEFDISPTAQTRNPIGYAQRDLDVSANYYCWLQVGGLGQVRADEAFAIGAQLTIGTGVAGETEALDAAAEPLTGIANDAGVISETKSARIICW